MIELVFFFCDIVKVWKGLKSLEKSKVQIPKYKVQSPNSKVQIPKEKGRA